MKNRVLLVALVLAGIIVAGCGTAQQATPTIVVSPTVSANVTAGPAGGENLAPSEKIEAALKQVYDAKLVYPEALELTEGVPFTLDVNLSRDTSEQAIEHLKQELAAAGVPAVQDLKVSSLMKIELQHDPALFRVEPKSESVQGVGPAQPVAWSWSVTPLRADRGTEQELRIIATALAVVDGGQIPSTLPTRRIKIRVNVNPVYSVTAVIQGYWWAPVGAVLLALLWRRGILFKRASNRAGPAPHPEPVAPVETTDARTSIPAVKLRQILVSHFNESELRDLCFDLGIDYEVLGGDDKGDKARELILYFGRVERTAELVDAIRRLRPQISL